MKKSLFSKTFSEYAAAVARVEGALSLARQRSFSAISGSCSWLILCVCAAGVQAQPAASVDEVTSKDGQVWALRGEQWEAVTNALKMPFDVEVNTNGTFAVAKGKERALAAGQVIRKDGWLINPDGSIQPVFDHVAMRAGKPMVVQDGTAQVITQTTTFTNNLTISPDGSCVYPSGTRTRLADGQLFRLDGTPIPAKDTATLKNGRVVVLKDGGLIPLSPGQIMGMNDGTKIQADGLITKPDGTQFKLGEGQTTFFEGRAARQ